MSLGDDAAVVAERARSVLDLKSARLSDAYFYNSLSLCVLDAIYSIGVRYESTEAVVRKYCEFYAVPRTRSDRATWPPRSEQEPLTALEQRLRERGYDAFAATVVRNRQRTSARGGILKAEAVAQFAGVLIEHGVEYFDDLPDYDDNSQLVAALRRVRGQGSGISVGYFWMLAGSDQLIKPDRMILGFLTDALRRPVAVWDARTLLREVTSYLVLDVPHLTPRLLDFKVWEYQRSKGKERVAAV